MRVSLALAVVAAVCATTVGSAAPAPAAPAAAAATISTVLDGGVGDGGPAAEALVNARLLTRDDAGNMWFVDGKSGQIRRVDAVTGLITAAYGNATDALPADVVFSPAVYLGAVSGLWVAQGDLFVEREVDDAPEVVRIKPDGATSVHLRLESAEDQSSSVTYVRRDASVVVHRNRYSTNERDVTDLVAADGVTTTRLLDHPVGAISEAADGTMIAVSNSDGTQIERIAPDATVDVVAGKMPSGNDGPTYEDGTPAVDTYIFGVGATAISPAGDRVSFLAHDVGSGNGNVIRTFPIGGAVTTIGRMTSDLYHWEQCKNIGSMVASEDSVLAVCRGAVRRFPLDGSTADTNGLPAFGLNRYSGWADSASGTPAVRAFLGRVRDVADDPLHPGRLAMATRSGVYAITGDGAAAVLTQLVPGLPGQDRDVPVENHEPDLGRQEPAVDVDYGPDGSLYVFTAFEPGGGETWRLRVRDPDDGSVAVLAGGGAGAPADGVAGTAATFGVGRIAASADGKRVYIASGTAVYVLDLATKALRRVAGGGTGTDGGQARSARLSTVNWLGTDPATGELLLHDEAMHRVGADGVLRAVESAAGQTFAFAPDGSRYSADLDDTYPDPVLDQVWRRQPDGRYELVLGRDRDRFDPVPLEPEVTAPRIAMGRDGNLVQIDHAKPTSVVRRLAPPAPSGYAGSTPTMSVTPLSDGERGTLRFRILPPAGSTWHVRVRYAYAPGIVAPGRGGHVYDLMLGPDAHDRHIWDDEIRAFDFQLIQPGQRFWIGMFAVQGDGSVAATPVLTSVTIPGRPTTLATPGATATSLTYGATSTLTGRLRLAADGSALPGRSVRLEIRRKGTSAWALAKAVTSGVDGTLTATVKPAWNAELRWVFPAAGKEAAATSALRSLTVRPKVSLTAPTSGTVGKTLRFTGSTSPAAAGTVVRLHRIVGSTWRTVTSVKTAANGTYAFAAKAPFAGKLTYRVERPGTGGLTTGTSPVRTVAVRKPS